MKHKFKRNPDGTIDIWAHEAGHHNGPECEICGESFCHHCYPECYDEECPGKKYDV